MEVKTCSDCNKEYPIDYFYPNGKWKDKIYRRGHCKFCDREKNKNYFKKKKVTEYEHRKNNPITKLRTRIRSIDFKTNNKKKIIEYLGGRCSNCGYSKCQAAMDLHHSDPSIKDKNKNSGPAYWFQKYKYETILEKVNKEKVVLLCSNCHREKHFLQDKVTYNRNVSELSKLLEEN